MKKLLNGINYELVCGSLTDIKELTIDSRTAKENSLFICLTGANVDGHDYIKDAYNLGCRSFLVEKDIDCTNLDNVNIFKVNNTREALSIISQNFYNNPARELVTIGITGTKGKTTTAEMIKKIFETNGNKCGLIGTLGVFIGDKHYKTMNTTPESLDIQRYFREMVENGCKYAVMEVSSQALKVGRVFDMIFDYGIFTNLSEDHIGENEHKDYDEYRMCKALLFKQCKMGILNKDDLEFSNIVSNATCTIKTFGIENDADYKVADYSFLHENGKIGMNFQVNSYDYKIYTPGMFSIYNALCASALAHELGVCSDTIFKALEQFKVKGRVEPIKVSDRFTLLIDYAHEAMSLKSLLTTIKEYNPKRIVTLFGCGGNRSIIRRYEMGEISGLYSDLTILTEDNSRFENVLDIIEDIKIGIHKTNGKYVVVENRKNAIKYAIENALDGDIVLLCGKGHEDYQELNGVRYHLDERELIQEILTELNEDEVLGLKKKK